MAHTEEYDPYNPWVAPQAYYRPPPPSAHALCGALLHGTIEEVRAAAYTEEYYNQGVLRDELWLDLAFALVDRAPQSRELSLLPPHLSDKLDWLAQRSPWARWLAIGQRCHPYFRRSSSHERDTRASLRKLLVHWACAQGRWDTLLAFSGGAPRVLLEEVTRLVLKYKNYALVSVGMQDLLAMKPSGETAAEVQSKLFGCLSDRKLTPAKAGDWAAVGCVLVRAGGPTGVFEAAVPAAVRWLQDKGTAGKCSPEFRRWAAALTPLSASAGAAPDAEGPRKWHSNVAVLSEAHTGRLLLTAEPDFVIKYPGGDGPLATELAEELGEECVRTLAGDLAGAPCCAHARKQCSWLVHHLVTLNGPAAVYAALDHVVAQVRTHGTAAELCGIWWVSPAELAVLARRGPKMFQQAVHPLLGLDACHKCFFQGLQPGWERVLRVGAAGAGDRVSETPASLVLRCAATGAEFLAVGFWLVQGDSEASAVLLAKALDHIESADDASTVMAAAILRDGAAGVALRWLRGGDPAAGDYRCEAWCSPDRWPFMSVQRCGASE